MATMLAPIGSRAVVRCDQCELTQFIPAKGLSSPCRRCKVPLDFAPQPQPSLVRVSHEMTLSLIARLPGMLRAQRLRLGLSQRQLAARLNGPRTYVSKIENGGCSPTLTSLFRVAEALEVTVPELLSAAGDEQAREAEVRDLARDKFIAELLPFVSRLSVMQMSSILARVSDMKVHRRVA